MSDTEIEKIVKSLYKCYETGDRALVEKIIAEDFSFTSPYDNKLDRKMFFEICWTHGLNVKKFEFSDFMVKGDRAFVLYNATTKNGGFRNFEVLTVEAGQISQIEVYFGWPLPHRVKQGEHSMG